MALRQGFFPNANQKNSVAPARHDSFVFTDVGGNGFRAVALGLVDRFEHALMYPRQTVDLIRTILDRHFTYFPRHQQAVNGLMAPSPRMHQLIASVNKLELIQALAYTLGRISFDELVAHPLLYRDVFLDQQATVLFDVMQSFMLCADKHGMAALAVALKLHIEVQQVEPGREIYAVDAYGFDETRRATGLNIVLQRQAGDYFRPLVTPSDWHALLQTPLLNVLQVAEHPIACSYTLLDIQAMIAKADDALLDRFDHTYLSLAAMARAGEQRKADWIAIYIKGLADRNKFQVGPRCVGTEHGNQAYFDGIVRCRRGVPPVDFPSSHYDDETINALVYAIARAISLGEMSPDAVDAYIDAQQRTHGGHEGLKT